MNLNKFQLSYSPIVKNTVVKLFDDIGEIKLTPKTYTMKRHALNQLCNLVADNKKSYVHAALFFLRKIAENQNIVGSDKEDKHILSDHAFCKILERVLKQDIKKLKDMALDNLLNNANNFYIIKRGEKILTVYEKTK